MAGFDQSAQLRNPAGRHEQHGQAEHEAIGGGQIRCTFSAPIADEQLLLQQRLRVDGTYTTRANQLCERHHYMEAEDEQFAHAANGIHHRQCAQDCTAGADCVALRIRHAQVRRVRRMRFGDC